MKKEIKVKKKERSLSQRCITIRRLEGFCGAQEKKM